MGGEAAVKRVDGGVKLAGVLWVAAARSKLAPTVGRAASQPVQTGSISGEYTLRGSVEV